MITIPDVPYMIVLGSSHTAGECDGKILKKTFADYIAEDLGLKLVKIGLRGCTNIELLFSFNKLVSDGFIDNENMKLFILEPRANNDGSFRIPLEVVFPDDAQEIISRNMEIKRYNWFEEYDIEGYDIENITIKEAYAMFSLIFSAINYEQEKSEVMHGLYLDANLPIDGNFKIPSDSLPALKNYSNYVISNYDTIKQFLDNMIIINSILNQLKSLNKTIAWILFNELDEQKIEIINTCLNKDLLDVLLLSDIENKIEEMGKTDEEFFCKCHHLNETGQKILYELLIDKIKEGYYDKTT